MKILSTGGRSTIAGLVQALLGLPLALALGCAAPGAPAESAGDRASPAAEAAPEKKLTFNDVESPVITDAELIEKIKKEGAVRVPDSGHNKAATAGDATTCNCLACQWPSDCSQGTASTCQYRMKIPCGYCCQ